MFQTISEDKFEVRRCVEEAAIIVTVEKDPKTTCFITLTSPIMREENLAEGGKTTAHGGNKAFVVQACNVMN